MPAKVNDILRIFFSNMWELERVRVTTTFRMASLMKSYLMLQNARFTAFTFFTFCFKGKPIWWGGIPATPRLRVKVRLNYNLIRRPY